MSLFGWFVAARTGRSLLELGCVRKACEERAGSVETTTAASVAWARACGLRPDPEAIAAAVGKYVGPFGEGVMDYLAALGLEFTSPG